jgi:hypothetical protein
VASRSSVVAMPFLGVESIQNSSATDEGPGLRLGVILGVRLNDQVSLNGEAVLDISNLENVAPGVDASEHTFQLAVAPLFHIITPGAPVELALGPKIGFFHVGASSSDGVGDELDATADGWLVGLNAALFGRLSDSVAMGGLFSFDYERATTCSFGGSTGAYYGTCSTNGEGIKVISFNAAAMF